MERDDPLADDEPHARLLPPDDRLWRHPSEVNEQGPPAKGRRPGLPPRLWVVAMLAGLTGAIFAIGLMASTGNMRRILRVPVVQRVAVQKDILPAEAASTSPEVLEISRRLRPAVVGIEIEVKGIDRRIRGAGVMFRSDGHVLTNQHVVEGAARIVVVMADGQRVDAKLVGSDTWSDIAVVKVDDDGTFPVITMGSSSAVAVGQPVMAIGGPVGREQPAPEVGVVGALGRELQRRNGPPLLDMIETTAAVAATSSGGALVDGTGAVVGIVTALGPGGEVRLTRAGLATPIDWARTIADQLLATGHVERAWMGVDGNDLDPTTALAIGVSGGAVLTQVLEGSPAIEAGLSVADVVTSVNGMPVSSMGRLRTLLRTHHPGDVISLAVIRGTQARTVKVQLQERPADT